MLAEHRVEPWSPADQRRQVRNGEWFHMYNDDIISMPDKWEYPWFAAWDLAFHAVTFALIDPALLPGLLPAVTVESVLKHPATIESFLLFDAVKDFPYVEG